MDLAVDDLLTDTTLRGSDFGRTYSDRLDAWIAAFVDDMDMPDGCALAAVGGYGRRLMAPMSDLDLVLVHEPDVDIREFADIIWYPIWDGGLKLGQKVDTISGLLRLSRSDLDTATSLLDARHLAGDATLVAALNEAARNQWRSEAAANTIRLAKRVDSLHANNGEVAFTLAPDIKTGRGGLRDIDALRWAALTGAVANDEERHGLENHAETLFAARVELHRLTGRPVERLGLDYQEEIAASLGYTSADALMAEIAKAARSIAWVSDACWFGLERSFEGGDASGELQTIAAGIEADSWSIKLAQDASPAEDPMLLFTLALEAARRRAFIDRATLDRLAGEVTSLPDPWTAEMREAFVNLLLAGRPAISVLESLDQVGLLHVIIPEWEPCRSKPQRNAYHRFTVDRHLIEAAAEASALVDKVDRPDLLVIGALLHDIGKGYPGDHVEVGVKLIDKIGERMGFERADIDTLIELCALHLLLPDVATRRDIDDVGTIGFVAEQVKRVETLTLLHHLTIADSIATGPAAWNASKAGLVYALADRVQHVLGGGAAVEVVETRFPTERHRELMAGESFSVQVEGTTITVVQSDQAGAFSRVAGVLTLTGLDIVAASAYTEAGVALSEFEVREMTRSDPAELVQQLELGTSGRLAIAARVATRRQTYARSVRRSSAKQVVPSLRFDDRSSETATVIEVTARDQIGLLYHVSRALADLGIEISVARIQTIGDTVIDAFYVEHEGTKITDPDHRDEIERAVLYAIDRA